MTIVSSSIGRDDPRNDGTRNIHEFHEDHIGRTHHFSYRLPNGEDAIAVMDFRVATLEVALSDGELIKLRSFIEENGSPQGFTRHHSTVGAFARRAVKVFMRLDATKGLKMAKYIQANVTQQQLENFFGVAIKDRIVARIAGLLAIDVEVTSDEMRQEDID